MVFLLHWNIMGRLCPEMITKRRKTGEKTGRDDMKYTKLAGMIAAVLMLALLVTACGGGDSKDDMYALTIDGVTIKGNTKVQQYLDKLGDDYEYSESISCAYDGLDKIYTYDNFSIYTYPQGDQDYVLEVEVLGGSYTTGKGIKIGSSRAEVIKVYGDKYLEDGILLYYNKTNDAQDATAPMLYFIMENDTVTGFGVVGESVEGTGE